MAQDGRRWATSAQVTWLMGKMPEYLEAQRNGRYDRFWQPFFQAYFDVFPEREPTANDDSEPEPDVPVEIVEEESLDKTDPGKRKQKAAASVARKHAKMVCDAF